jgi:glycosyltransferase involved in cell wall biosynthesis
MSPRKSARAAAPPAVTVVICTHDRRDYLRATLRSAYRQTYRDFEIVLVDDASTDGTAAWVRRGGFPRLELIELKRNGGPLAALVVALARARGRFVAFLDSDDLWYPRFLETAVARMRRPEVMVATANFDTIDAGGALLERRRGPARQHAGLLAVSGLAGLPMPSLTVVRRSALLEVGGMDAGFKWTCYDIDLFLRLGLRFGPAAFRWIGEPLGAIRRHASLTSQLPDMDAGTFAATLGARCRGNARQGELVLDWLYLRHKHAHWTSLVDEASGVPASGS